MNFRPTKLEGLWLIELCPVDSNLGYFARSYCENEFASMGLATSWPQSNETLTKQCGSLRGMHWQSEPHGEAKIVRCLHGSVLDVVVDVRAESKTFGEFQSFELSGANLNQLYIPKGFAHGYQTLEDNCIIHYQMSAAYHAPSATGFRWNDPFVGISWPLQVKNVSERDANLPFLGDLGLR